MQPLNPSHPTFQEALQFWLKLGFISFGGPAGQIAMMHSELVERRRWISEDRFLHALNYCMLLPGPEAQQLAIYTGWLLHRTWGGIVAGVLFVLPSAILLWALSWIYVAFGSVPMIAAIFAGLKPAVIAIVAAAIFRIGGRVLKNPAMWSVSALAFVALYFFHVPFPAVIVGAGIIGWIGDRVAPEVFRVLKTSKLTESAVEPDTATPQQSWGRIFRVVGTCSFLWWMPMIALGSWLGWNHTIWREGVLFSKAAMVTFGGAYAVLPYVAQQAVSTHNWVTHGQMLDGLGLAESTPGPLIMVLQFVGFLGAWNYPGALSPLFAATLGAIVTTWATFLPCFMWIFAGAPTIERLRGNVRLTSALSSITAAVVGVIFNLAITLGQAVIFPGTVQWFALATCLVAIIAVIRYKLGVIPLVIGAAVLGIFRYG